MRTPIALLVAEDYEALPYKLPRAYMALGWFWIIDSWVSVQNGAADGRLSLNMGGDVDSSGVPKSPCGGQMSARARPR